MSLILELSTGEQVPLDDSWVIEDLEMSAPDAVQRAALQHGGKDTAWGYFEARRLLLRGALCVGNIPGYNDARTELLRTFYQRQMKLYDNPLPTRYLQVTRMVSFRESFIEGTAGVAELEAEFLCENPFWQSCNVVTDARTLSSGDYAAVYNPGNVECSPVVTFQGLGATPQILFKNTTDGSQLFTYTDLSATLNSTIVVDGVEGTVTRSGQNALRFFTGSFLKLLPGVNTLYYEGARTYYSLQARPQYL